MNLRLRSDKKELLDGEGIPFEDIRQNMHELNIVNRWLGGHAITVAGLKDLLGNDRQVSICEIGCGGGDNLYALAKWCERNKIAATFTGIDIKPECINYGRHKYEESNIEWQASDYRDAQFAEQPDIIFSSLFCHHFSDKELIEQVKWLQQNSTKGFFINDLHRHTLAYVLIKFLTSIFSSSYLVKHDAPLSVARGFVRGDWTRIFKAANIASFKVTWKWAFRFLVTFKHD